MIESFVPYNDIKPYMHHCPCSSRVEGNCVFLSSNSDILYWKSWFLAYAAFATLFTSLWPSQKNLMFDIRFFITIIAVHLSEQLNNN